MSPSVAQMLEMVAVALAILYLVLAMRQNIWCWAAAFVSTGIYLFLFFDVTLYMESGLQVFYLAMAVYGWSRWRKTGGPDSGLPVSSWRWQRHLVVVAGVLVLSAFSGYALASRTDAALPYLDSFTTWGAVVTTWMVTVKLLENWLYWIVIDLCSIWLYVERGLNLTAWLFALYVVLAAGGYLMWRTDYRRRMAGGVPAGAAVPADVPASG